MKGNIQQRGPRTWRLRYDVPSPEGRKQISETVRGNKRDAQRTLRERLAAIDKGIYIERNEEAVAEYLERWLKVHSTKVSIRTRVGYATCINRFKRHFGAGALQKLRPEHIQASYDSMLESGLTARTVLHSHRVLSQALKDAVKWGLILRNPADVVSPPRAEKKEATAWDSDTIKKFMDAAEGSRYRDAYSLAALTGMRRSELAGLKWPDIDLKSGRLRVVRTRQRIYGHGIVEGQPKTHRSRRSVALSPSAVSVLDSVKTKQIEMRLRAGPLWQHTDYVLTKDDGAPIAPDHLSREFSRIVKEAGLPKGTLHGLRHSYATALLSANVHPAVVQSALGHSSITLTIDTYSHVMPGLEEAAARRIDDILGDAVAGNS